jgi:hypothetical protein
LGKLLPSARFILPGAVFHRDGLPVIEPLPMLNKPEWQLYLFCNKNLIIKLNFPQKNRAEHGAGCTEEKQTLLSKKKKKSLILTELGMILCRNPIIDKGPVYDTKNLYYFSNGYSSDLFFSDISSV